METTRKQFNAQTVRVDTRAIDHRGMRFPCLNVKVRHGFESITPEQWGELRNMARDGASIVDGTIPEDSLAGLNAQWCQAHLEKHENYEWWNDACQSNFEQAEEDAKALFGKHVECFQDGRSGGWLVVKGLPEIWEPLKAGDGCWDCWTTLPDSHVEGEPCEECGALTIQELPSLKGSNVEGASFSDGTRLADDANIYERWAFFAEVCAGLVKDVPYECASLLALNVFPRLEGTREVEFLRAWADHTWDTITLAVPGKVTTHDDLVAYCLARPGRTDYSVACIAVYHDPKGD